MTLENKRLKNQLLAEKERLEAQVKETATVSVSNVGYGNHMAVTLMNKPPPFLSSEMSRGYWYRSMKR